MYYILKKFINWFKINSYKANIPTYIDIFVIRHVAYSCSSPLKIERKFLEAYSCYIPLFNRYQTAF